MLSYAKVASAKSDKGRASSGKITTIVVPEKKEAPAAPKAATRNTPSTPKVKEKKKHFNNRNGNPNAPPKLSHAERTSRGPLPDWDEIQNCKESFDYMGLRDTLYAQYYAAAMPQPVPFDSNNNYEQNNIMIQNHLDTYGFRPIVPVPYMVDPNFSPGVVSPVHFYPEYVNTVPFLPMYAMPSPLPIIPDDELKSQIRKQIEYYFSKENLEKDTYLRNKMDSEGYLPLSLIASFPRVRKLTEVHNFDPAFICDSIRSSEKIELSEDEKRIRSRITPNQSVAPATEVGKDDAKIEE